MAEEPLLKVELAAEGRRTAGESSGRLEMRSWIQAEVVWTFWSSFAEGFSGSARTAARRKRMSSRIDATAGWKRRAVSHEEKGTSEDIKGVLSATRRGICELSRNSNSGAPRRKGETS